MYLSDIRNTRVLNRRFVNDRGRVAWLRDDEKRFITDRDVFRERVHGGLSFCYVELVYRVTDGFTGDRYEPVEAFRAHADKAAVLNVGDFSESVVVSRFFRERCFDEGDVRAWKDLFRNLTVGFHRETVS